MGILANEVQEHKADFADFGYKRNDKVSFEISQSSPFSTNNYTPFLPDKRYSSWKRLPFGKFSFQPITLCVLKLDGSSFDIIVTKKATVAKLKQAVEAAFNYLPKQGDSKVSWSHVWGQFCLCFQGQKLLRDRDSIVRYGIRNGDQLRFVRHTPHVNINLATERSDKLTYITDEAEGSSSKMDYSYIDTKKNIWNNPSNQPKLVLNEINDGYVDFGANTKPRPKWGCTMRGLFSNRRLEGPAKGHDHVVNSTIRLGRSFQNCELCVASSSYYTPKEHLRRGGGFKHDDTNINGMKDNSCRSNAGSDGYGSCGQRRLFNGFTGGFGGFGYPTGYYMK